MHGAADSAALAPGKQTLTSQPQVPEAPVQRHAVEPTKPFSAGDVQAAAAHGTSGGGTALPHLDRIQRLFGRHDVSHVQAYVSGRAAEGAEAMGAEAFATRDRVAFARPPDVRTAAHEAAHVVQQRAGVQLKGSVGEVGDKYEQHADAVADQVVAGQSAEALLSQMAPTPARSPAGGVQRAVQLEAAGPGDGADVKAMLTEAIQIVETALAAAHGEAPEPERRAAGGSDDGAPAPASTATRFTPEQIAHLEEMLTNLHALHNRPADEVRAATQPIIQAAHGRSSQPASTVLPGGPGGPVQRFAMALPLALAGPPGWVALGVLAIGAGISVYRASLARERAREREGTMNATASGPKKSGRWTCHARSAVLQIPKQLPVNVCPHADTIMDGPSVSGSNEAAACKAAKHAFNDMMPEGCRPKHMQCKCTKR